MVGTRGPGENKPKLEALQTANQGIVTRTDKAALPTSGSADYEGYAQIISYGTDLPGMTGEVVGKADLKVNFAGLGGMTGKLSEFDDPFGTYTGELLVSGGSISSDAGGERVTGAVAGTLTRSSGHEFAVSGNLTGGFFGADGQYLTGVDKVTVSSGGVTATTDITLNAARK